MSDFAWLVIGAVLCLYLMTRPSVDVEKLQAAAEKEKRDKRINDLEYRIRAWEERNGRS